MDCKGSNSASPKLKLHKGRVIHTGLQCYAIMFHFIKIEFSYSFILPHFCASEPEVSAADTPALYSPKALLPLWSNRHSITAIPPVDQHGSFALSVPVSALSPLCHTSSGEKTTYCVRHCTFKSTAFAMFFLLRFECVVVIYDRHIVHQYIYYPFTKPAVNRPTCQFKMCISSLK